MKIIKLNHLLGLAIMALTSLQASAQAYYPYNVADYPGSIDRGQQVYGYPASNQGSYGGSSYNRSPYPGYPQQGAYYGQNRGYTQQPAQRSTQNYAPQQYRTQQGYNYPQGYAYNPRSYPQQAYGYSRPGYPPQAYYYAPRYNKSNGMNKMFKPEKWRGRNFGEEFWPGNGSIYEDALPAHGPWDRNWGKAPWNREYEDMWGDEGGPEAWMDFSDPKEGLAWMWEDFLYTPNALGTMPGGWEAPSISVPNPVDVGDEFQNASTDFPGEMKDFADGFTYGDRTMTGSKPSKDGGSFGMGNKEKDGINISPKTR